MLVLAASPAAMVQGKQIPPKKYSSCAALRKDFPKGLAFSTLFVEATGATVNAKAYNLNWKALGGLATRFFSHARKITSRSCCALYIVCCSNRSRKEVSS